MGGAAWSGAGAASTAARDVPAVTLSADPLGIDVAPWDSVFSNPATLTATQTLLKAAHVTQLHYGGGVSADQYDWQTNTDIANCPNADTSEFAASCAYNPALPFDKFSADARTLGAQSFVTVNYGSGTPALAKAWVTQSQTAGAGQGVADWEIGNEGYGCWENNDELALPPENYQGYEANISSTCPMNQPAGVAAGMDIMSNSYAYNAGLYMQAMLAADPTAQIGVPWAFTGAVGGAGVEDNSEWNDTVLGDDGQYIGFVDAHFYPFSFAGDTGEKKNPTAQTVIQSVEKIPTDYASIQTTLNTYDPTAQVIVGETGVSYLATNVPCTPTGALFAAGDALEWLAAGAQSIDWWPLDTAANLGTKCTMPDEGMFTNAGQPNSTYTGYLLASALAQPNAELSALTTSNPADVLAFQSVLPDGQVAVALINTDTSSSEKVTVSTSLTGNLTTDSYSAGKQNATNTETVTGTTTAGAVAGGITLAPESILILKSYQPAAITLGAAASVRAGTKVALHGTLTLNRVAAPAGTTVKIYRRVAGSSVNSATLTIKTGANGSFTATDVPPSYGNYNYVASYPGSSLYEWATSSLPVHITALKPALKLAVSAKSAKPGAKVTVTASLGAWHTNRTLAIYAQPKGGKKTLIKRATINSKGKLSVVYTVRANTTFTVTFSGDGWYASASATAAVSG
ncbi:MAG: hypothetical protein ABSA02_03200 [Trebonia sp.]